MFPRAVWMDSFHTEPLMEMPQIRDLITRMAQIACLPDEERSCIVPEARSEAFPVDLRPLAEHCELSARLRLMEENDRSLYYGFWELFRAASIRGVLLERGDTSFDNRLALADACLEMAAIMLRHEKEGEKIILPGDLEFAERMAQTAHSLLVNEENIFAADLRRRAEELYGSVDVVRKLLREQPERFELRQRYGPFLMHKRAKQ
jgi:hypothetical protein